MAERKTRNFGFDLTKEKKDAAFEAAIKIADSDEFVNALKAVSEKVKGYLNDMSSKRLKEKVGLADINEEMTATKRFMLAVIKGRLR